MMVRRIVLEDSEQLPEGYTALEYIQSSGTQYIDTGRKLTQDSDITIDFKLINNNKSVGILGSRESAAKNNLALFRDGGLINGDFSEYPKYRFKANESFNRTKIRMNKTGVLVNGVLNTSWSGIANFETPTNGLIFDIGNNNWTGNKAVMQLYSYTDGNTQKLVPCLDTEGVPCMFDLVSQKPFYNAGTGSFTWG